MRTTLAASSIGLVALLSLPAAGVAGTGRLISSWMSRPPTIDGRIEAAEWAAATTVAVGRGVTARIANDGGALYLAVLDANIHTLRPDHNVYLHFDDEGGMAPILDDGAFTHRFCGDEPQRGEGVLVFGNDGRVTFQEWTWSDGECRLSHDVTDRLTFAVAARPEGLSYETTIPLAGSMPLVAGAGQRLGVWLRVQRLDGTFKSCLPAACGGLAPIDWQNLVLASGGCNTGTRDFSAGLPLDWTSSIAVGSGWAWAQSGIGGSAAHCEGNITGASGAAACVASSGYTSAQSAARLVIPLPRDIPLPLAGQADARAFFWMNFQSAVPGTDFMSFDVEYVNGGVIGFNKYWNLGNPAGPGVPVAIWIGPDMVNLIITHYTAGGGTVGGLAQMDDFELQCPEPP